MSNRPVGSRLMLAALVSLFAAATAGCSGSRPDPSAVDITIQHLQKSNIATWAGGRSGTNRWVGDSDTGMPVIEVVVPAPRSGPESRIAASAHAAIVEVNRRMAGLLALRDVAKRSSHQAAHIEVSYMTAYVPPASIDDRAFCANASEARGQAGRFRPGPDGHRNHGIAWLNLGNGHCTVRTDEVIRQIAVALGLDAPFPGFESHAPAVSEALWDALATLYANPVQTAASELHPHRTDLPAAEGLAGPLAAAEVGPEGRTDRAALNSPGRTGNIAEATRPDAFARESEPGTDGH